MENLFLESESFYRLLFFILGLGFFWILGLIYSYRKLSKLDRWRWLNNLALILLNSFVVRLALPIGLVTFAAQNSFGLFHLLKMNQILEVLLSVIILDLIIYFQHLVFHHVPILWRLHAVHHSDPGFDTTTALRFHPIEICLSIVVKAVAIFLLGLSPVSVLVFEILLNFSAMFNHSNFRLPKLMEGSLAKIIVTPDFHRVHHSMVVDETNSNFGFFLSIWDKIFRTYKAKSKNDLKEDVIGLELYRSSKEQRLDSLLLQPFKKEKKA
jgi:sterol desaturase/sphingolipid hydroxylase (fatty acid hydroxylase superfamily)